MPRLIFANQLRGVAALCVAGSHLVGAFWGIRDYVGLATASPVQGGPPPAIFGLFSHTYLNFGPLGVGVFFLISGLVVPLSLEHHTRASFITARLLRIYPTYLAALLIEMLALKAAAVHWGRPFPYSAWTVASNALLIHNMVGQPAIDFVNWTLCIELKFYLLVMLLAAPIRRGSVAVVLLTGGLLLSANLVAGLPAVASRLAEFGVAGVLSAESLFIIFMLIGVLFNFNLRGLLPVWGLALSVAALLAMFLLCWTHSTLAAQYPIVTVNYLYDAALFAILFFCRNLFRSNRILDFFAAISFPFYLVHSLLGYLVLKLLMFGWGVPYLAALGPALAVGVAVAVALHRTVEVKTILLGRSLSRRPVAHRPLDPPARLAAKTP